MNKLRIAVADDERDMREYLEAILPDLGYDVVVAASDGLELAQRCASAKPDLIITDIKMPTMDGIEAALRICEERPVPVILVSAYHDAELIERAGAEHILAYLVKPIKQSDLEPAIAIALGRFRQLRQLRHDVERSTARLATDQKLVELNHELALKNSELERFALQADKLVSIGTLAASVAHEIRNPLTAIKLRLFSLQQNLGESRQSERFRGVREEINRLERILQNFLDFSRPSNLALKPCPVSQLLDSTLELYGHHLKQKCIEVVRVEEPGLPDLLVDPDQVKQVLLNLLINAVDAVNGTGQVHISVSHDNGVEPAVVVRLRDTGVGMGPDVAGRIFDPFFSTKQGGTGLGLPISAKIIERHGGTLTLESTSPEGTCFAVRLPIKGSSAAVAKESTS